MLVLFIQGDKNGLQEKMLKNGRQEVHPECSFTHTGYQDDFTSGVMM